MKAPFQELFELSPDAILVYLGGVVTHANPAALLLLRATSANDLIGLQSRQLITPECLPSVEQRATALMNGARSTRGEERYVRVDGTIVDVEATAARAPLFDGKAFIVFLRDITDRKEAEERLRREREAASKTAAAEERERWLRDLIDLLPVVVFAMDDQGAFVLVNERCAELFGRPKDQILGRCLSDMGFAADAFRADQNAEILASGQPKRFCEGVVMDARGRPRIFEGVKVLLRRGEDKAAVLGAMTELTDRRALEEQLLHSQKMEGIGRLAGGVAHDFNNLLTVIIESTDHLSGSMPDPEDDLPRIREASTRAASLTRQLLAFAHQAPTRPQIISMDDLVSRMARLLIRVLGEDVKLTSDLAAGGARANVDAGQLEVVVMNIAVNARDAMPSGGNLTLATRTRTERLRANDEPVPCIVLEVRDTGVGMDEATRVRAFEPFFTTKQLGIGTGLGLATSYGIVEQLGGRIEIDSIVGRGTTVRVLIPRCETQADVVTTPAEAPPKPGQETVLVLEDEPAVRRATTRMLRSLGYVVLDAALPSEALALARDHGGPIDALVTDVVMPQMNGVEAAREFRDLRPNAAVLFVSGYSRNALKAGQARPLNHLDKPFTKGELANALREALGPREQSPR
jgi:PAS domain S-box-containing protein